MFWSGHIVCLDKVFLHFTLSLRAVNIKILELMLVLDMCVSIEVGGGGDDGDNYDDDDYYDEDDCVCC